MQDSNANKISTETLLKVARMAGDRILEIYNNEDFSQVVDFKADDSPLTLADKAAHDVIYKELRELDPDTPILSEEGDQQDYEVRKHWQYFWLVDPLDGTKEFIKRNGEFTVNIALVYKGMPMVGVIYAPDLDLYYYARKGQGAWKQKDHETVQPLKVSGRKKDCVAVQSRSHASEEEQQIFDYYNVKDSVSVGSSLKFCMVAEGKADIYYRHGPTMEWDTGAGQAILEAAGGTVTDPEGNPFTYNKKDLTNGKFLAKGF